MRGIRTAYVIAFAALAALAAPAGAQPADEIELDPEPPPAKPPTPPPAKPPTPPPAKPPTPPPAEGTPAADPAAPAAPVKDPKAAKKWLATGQQLLQQGDWFARAKKADDAKARYENAVTAFQKSIDAGDDLSTYALLAEAEDKLGKPELAAQHYRVVIKAQAGVRPDVQKKATTKFEELSTKLGIVKLTVVPDGTEISLGGNELGKSPLADPLILAPGTYVLSFRAEGFQPKETEIVVEAGSEADRAIDLEPVKIVVQQPPPVEPPPPPKPPSGPSRLPVFISAGAGAALLGVAVVTGALAVGQHGVYTGQDSTAIEREDARTNGKRFALVSDLSLVGGLAAGGFAAYWYFVKYRPAQRKHAEARPAGAAAQAMKAMKSTKVDVVPWVQPGASGFLLTGAF